MGTVFVVVLPCPLVNRDVLCRYKYDEIFDTLNPIDGKVSGGGTHLFYIFLSIHVGI